jgi:EAL domain-containing protein (putative c-di-GMP-specific phosphodiesterase class I)
LGLHQPLALARLPRELLLQLLLPWLVILIGLICLPAGLLLMLRGLRRNQRLERRRLLRRLREERRLEPGSGLIGRAEWLERLERRFSPAGDAGGQRLALLGVRIQTFRATLHDGARARQRAQQLLVRLLREQGPDRQFAYSPDNHLLMAYRIDASLSVEHEEAQLRQLLEAAERSLAETMQVRLSALITPLGSAIGAGSPGPGRGLEHLVADLDLLQNLALPSRPVQFLGGEDRRRAAALRRQISSDFDCNRLAANLRDHRYRPEAVHHLPAEPGDGWVGRRAESAGGPFQDPPSVGSQVAYTELLFRLPEGMESGLSIQELILSLERNGGVHLIDTLMLRKAISLTREVEGPRPLLATNLSATTLQSLEHRSAILNLLRATPVDVRKNLALEVTETSVIADLDAWDGFLQDLRQLGLKVVIDDFGTGYASLAYLFRFKADFIKVDRQFSHRLHDPDVEAMVDFLLHYQRHHGTGIVMEGIETVDQLRYWQRRGLSRFQGYLFTPVSSSLTPSRSCASPAPGQELPSSPATDGVAAVSPHLHQRGAAQLRQRTSAMRAV